MLQASSSDSTNKTSSDGKIKPLSEEVIAKIAAGEVIIGPSNAIKELLENSLDAGADSITIEVSDDAGLKCFKIKDNGCGIGAKDLEIVCMRHTTSKLTSYDDLKTISTFGFRGEALSSVSQCAHVTIISKTQEQECAIKASYKNGHLDGALKKSAGIKGTCITAENLFYDNKTRREAINKSTEMKKITEITRNYALLNTGVSITLKKLDGKPIFHTDTKSTVKQNIKTLFSSKIEKEIMDVDIKNEKLELTGKAYFTNVNFSSKEKEFIIFVNKRLISHRDLKRAVLSVFEPYLPKGGHPFVFLSLMLNPRKVDVNLHPTKKEILFLDQEAIIEEVKETIRKKLLGSNESRVFDIAQKIASPRPSTQPSSSSSSRSKSSLLSNEDEDGDYIVVPASSSSSFTQKEQPKNKVRTSSSDQTGQMERYLTPQKRTIDAEHPPADTEPSVKKRKETPSEDIDSQQDDSTEEDVHKLDSVIRLKAEISADTHTELKTLLKKSTFVGWINPRLSLIQYNDKLILLNMAVSTKHLIYQRIIHKLSKFKYINLPKKLDIRELVKATEIDSSAVSEVVSQISAHRDLLKAYFGIVITEDDKLEALPHILENYIPPLHRLPDFFYNLATKVDWLEELSCIKGISIQLSNFYGLCESYELEEPQEGSNSQVSNDSTTSGVPSCIYTKERLQWITEHVIFPSIKLVFNPPNDMVNDGSVVEIASLPDLFKIFERC
ncbi:hypothetical protein C9374_010273 [Naegleria lovaniensis]|uniref:DNA mismatch repair protein S5 domain-containing protein n=1 Tax=Naegleria lovaniensis TaxID=51637 RepID=A0AA88KFZ0_NAELO|nr:uncharacterized protein C9374_010273 [Naegleria lovaniensis]KAG2374899.1 hypothetical protein C9374_010273 [Naegleria lovaniensis]